MRYVVHGAGAIGGVVGARLFRAGVPVVLIARGAHLAAIRRGGLGLSSPEGSESCAVPAVGAPSEIGFRGDDVVLLATKTQDAAAALDALRDAAVPAVPVVCLQNGLESARLALRRFERVLGAMLMLPTSHLEPGVVLAHSAPVPGVVDLGRFPPARTSSPRRSPPICVARAWPPRCAPRSSPGSGLNGEIALLGRLHDVPTPLNAALQSLAGRLARERRSPASLGVGELRASLSRAPS